MDEMSSELDVFAANLWFRWHFKATSILEQEV